MVKKKRVDSDESEEDLNDDEVAYSEDEQPVKPKKAKRAPKEDEEEAEGSTGVKVKKDADKNSYFELSDTRRVTVRKYKGSLLVDIREYYKDKSTGEMKPGSKGISMNADQWKLVRENVELIDELIEKA